MFVTTPKVKRRCVPPRHRIIVVWECSRILRLEVLLAVAGWEGAIVVGGCRHYAVGSTMDTMETVATR